MGRSVLLIVLSTLLVMFVLTTPALSGRAAGDFVVYWSATRLLVSHQNPYDAAALRALQEAVFPEREEMPGLSFASWNPPWLLLALLPLGLLPFDIAARLMFLVNLLLIAGAAVMTWRWARPGDSGTRGMLSLAAAVFFAGSLMTLAIGQIAALVLISLIGGLWFIKQRQDLMAGALLLLSLSKPHVVFFPLLVLGIWTLRERRWRICLGGTGALILSALLCTLLYRDWWSGYWSLVGGHAFSQYSTATVGGLIYAITGSTLGRYLGIGTLLLLPAMLSLVDTYGWLTGMNVALLISLPLAPYGFGFDQVVLVPSLVQLLSWLLHRRPSRTVAFLYGGLAVLYAVAFWMLLQEGLPYYMFVWIPVALGALYFVAWRDSLPSPSWRTAR